MDTLIHWQWVTWLRLCASVSTPTSEELVRRSWRPTSSLGVTWRCRSNTGNDLCFKNAFRKKESSTATSEWDSHCYCVSYPHRNVLSEDEIGNQRGCHVCARRRRGCAVVSDLVAERSTGHHRRGRITTRVDVHQRHTRYLSILSNRTYVVKAILFFVDHLVVSCVCV